MKPGCLALFSALPWRACQASETATGSSRTATNGAACEPRRRTDGTHLVAELLLQPGGQHRNRAFRSNLPLRRVLARRNQTEIGAALGDGLKWLPLIAEGGPHPERVDRVG